MSKNNPQEDTEAQEEPEYQEPTYNSTIGKNEKALNDDALLKLVDQAKTNKKGKKNRKEHKGETKSTKKEKKIIIDDPSQLKEHITYVKTPAKSATKSEEKSDFTQLSQAQYKNTAILATVSGQIEESDISRFFNTISIYKIHPEPGYFIIEFSTEEDLHKALQKNKTPYQNNITVLVGEYSIEDENPKPEKHDFPKPYQSSRYYNDDDYDDYQHSSSKQISLGGKFQQQTESSRPAYQPKKTTGFTLGTKVQQQQTESNKSYTPYKPATKPYQPAYANSGESKLPFGKQENLKPLVTSNSFGILKDDS